MTPFNRLFSVAVKPWFIAGYAALVTLAFLLIDKPLAVYLKGLELGRRLFWLVWITNLGLGGTYFIALLFLALFFRFVMRNPASESAAWFLWLCVTISSGICLGLKIMLGRARPDLWFQDQLYGFYGLHWHAPYWSLPSGHTTTVMAFVFAAGILFPRYAYALMAAGIVIAMSRILLVHHYLSDVLVAGYLAFIEVGLIDFVLRRRRWLIYRPEN